MYYLIDTNRNNGCLRAIPGSHRKRHRLHDLPPQGAEEIRDVDESHPALLIDPDEVDVPVKAGDLVIGDHRLLHSAHPKSQQRHTVVVLWFCPTYDQLPEAVQAIYGRPRSQPGQLEPCGLGFGETPFRQLPGESKASASQPNPR